MMRHIVHNRWTQHTWGKQKGRGNIGRAITVVWTLGCCVDSDIYPRTSFIDIICTQSAAVQYRNLSLHTRQRQRCTAAKCTVQCRALQLRFDYDTTTTYRARLLPFDAIRREQKMNMSIIRRSRIAVQSNANRNFDHFPRSRMRRGIVVS